ncbi:MAG: glutamine--tRNA ligase/YqeY domain fusion protein [Candidatus Improbicoccus pseudotrichonymphae]|uniref:Glutamine--tRNA ligase n=1 Tax=Candidatus Improbicoccus pseudotrichonymphae TaxID=3033792 RepID=A0AA48I267_9FIRM|nr:MAG: glutamine--tRNA ligase/YqeY domain fusion protein [Candidatus Improbicoccus pseudotrichonymphae]
MRNEIDLESSNFLDTIIKKDLSEGGKYYGKKIVTRFPPEPNGFLHIGHAKAICINFLIAEKFGGLCNLRMDDTNPEKEETLFIESIEKDVKWLGFDWRDELYYASDYFSEMFEIALNLINKGLAYVCELTAEQTKEYRGDLKNPAISPFRDRPIDESFEIFNEMRDGKYPNGKFTLRAKIDLNSGNFNMRDPIIYRILHAEHHRTGKKWPIYPTYDFAHPIEDMLEGITHSLCSLEFEDHRPLYNWVVENAKIDKDKGLHEILSRPDQIEFARLNMDYTVMSKRKLKKLVEEKVVDGWDDPRMPTLSGLRRRGYTPEAIRNFCSKIGISKAVGVIETSFLEVCIKNDLNKRATRVMVVIDPLELVIENYPESREEEFEICNNPTSDNKKFHKAVFTKKIFIERTDFEIIPKKDFYRLSLDSIVRLKSAYCVKCTGFEKNKKGEIVRVFCIYYPETLGGKNLINIKVKGTIHWVSSKYFTNINVNIYDKLFLSPRPESDGNFMDKVNPDSLKFYDNCKAELFLKDAVDMKHFQFMRVGYFVFDKFKSSNDKMMFNQTIKL